MSQANTATDRAEAVRRKTLAILSSLCETGKTYGLPEPPLGLEQCRQKLECNTYQVLVVGEAKRGKSTFVNALIGRNILPTDVDIATSQVFRVSAAEHEAYRLRLEDDSQQAIDAADLPRYGSQLVADTEGVPRLDQIIRWIEVDVPVRFLPANVRILDTPGLGALYAAHAQITHRFVPHADGVIFVLDSQAPIGEPEMQFVAKLLDVTTSIFFIQTKIDQFRREAWQEIQKRNQDLLAQRFKDRLPDPRVWPISSTNLRKAAQTGDDDYLMVSRHKELAAALQAFLFRVAGWSRSAQAIVLAGHYQSQARQLLTGRLDVLLEESKQKRAEFQHRAQERRRQFDADWGERGQKRRDLLESIHKIAALGKQCIRQGLQPGGDIETYFRTQIDQLASTAQIEPMLKSLPQEVEAQTLILWKVVQQGTETKCAEVLAPFAVAAEGVLLPPATEALAAQLGTAAAPEAHKKGVETWLKTVRNASFAGGFAHLAIGAVFPPAAVAAGGLWLVAGIAILVVGIPTVLVERRTQVKTGKQDLTRYLAELLQRLRTCLLVNVDLTAGQFSRVDECFNALERSLVEQIGKVTNQKLAEAQTESNRLAEEAQLDDKQRKEKAEETRRHLTEWDGIGRSIKDTQVELAELDRIGTIPGTASP